MTYYTKPMRLLESPALAGDRGVTTALAWMIRPDDTDDGLAFGTDDGYLCVWKRSCKEQEVSQSKLSVMHLNRISSSSLLRYIVIVLLAEKRGRRSQQ